MRPHDSKACRAATGVGGVRGILKTKLWWRHGFPCDGEWVVVPRDKARKAEKIELSRSDLSRATYAVKELVADFPKALPKVVGKVEVWQRNLKGMLDEIKPSVHGQAKPRANHFVGEQYFSRAASRFARELCAGHPEVEVLVDALSWYLLSEPDSALAHLRYVADVPEALARLLLGYPGEEGLTYCVQFVRLGVVHDAELSGLLSLVSRPCTGFRGADDFLKNVEKAAMTGKTHSGVVAEGNVAKKALQCLEWLVAGDRKLQSRFLSMLSVLDLGPLTEQWSDFWRRAQALATKVDNVASSYESEARKRAHQKDIGQSIVDLRSLRPAQLHERAVVEAMRWFAGAGSQYHNDALAALSGAQGMGDAGRAYFLVHWHLHITESPDWNRRRTSNLLQSFAVYASSPTCDYSPWEETLILQGQCGRYRYSIDESIVDEDVRVTDVPLVFDSFSKVSQSLRAGNTKPSNALRKIAEEVIELVGMTHDSDLSAKLAVQMFRRGAHNTYYSSSVIQAALLVSGRSREQFVDLLEALDRIETNTSIEVLSLVQSLQRVFANHYQLLLALLLAKDQRMLQDCGQLVASLVTLGGSSELETIDSGNTLWIERYPEKLHPSLRTLSEVSEAAETTAGKLSKGVIRNEAAMEREMEALRSRIAESSGNSRNHQEARLENLKALLASEETVSDAKLVALENKIVGAAGRELLTRIHAQATVELRTRLQSYLGRLDIPNWVYEANNLSIVLSSLSLNKSPKNLAKRMFQTRMGPAPWDLRDAQENRQFIEKMGALAIEVTPWIDGFEMKRTTARGVLHMRFADDPLDVFRMGGHFQTCLSPGNMNFFSVFANAADINKRVLYAYDDDGKVVGRQLLCLSDSGEIVAYHSYSHNSEWSFAQHGQEFIRALCEKMNARLSVRGSISTLVSSEWYDDGAVALFQRPEALGEDGSFAKSLATIDVQEFLIQLDEIFGQVPLEETLVPLFEISTFSQRSELLAAIAPRLDYMKVEGYLRPRVARALLDSEEKIPAVLIKALVDHVKHSHRLNNWTDVCALEMIAPDNPALVLSLLRNTRERGNRKWENEVCAARLVLAANAMIDLKRPASAAKLYRLALQASGDDYGRKAEARARLDELELHSQA